MCSNHSNSSLNSLKAHLLKIQFNYSFMQFIRFIVQLFFTNHKLVIAFLIILHFCGDLFIKFT